MEMRVLLAWKRLVQDLNATREMEACDVSAFQVSVTASVLLCKEVLSSFDTVK